MGQVTRLNIPGLSTALLEGGAELDGSVLRVRLTGNADLRSALQLHDWLQALHAEAARLCVSETIVDLRTLAFMNSSCFKALLSWISEVRDGDERQQYRIRLLSDPGMLWQKRSLHALSCFAIDLITVEACS